MKIPLIPAGIEPATFRFVAQHLNHCATADSDWATTWKTKGSRFDSLYRKDSFLLFKLPSLTVETTIFFFPVALRPDTDQGLLILEVSRSHTTTHDSQ